MKVEFSGDILPVRELEDTIRVTRKYTKGAFSRAQHHPIQGAEFPSRVLTEYYEVYPELEIHTDMNASDAWAWVWGDVIHIDVHFLYDYRNNKAKITVYGGPGAVKELANGISGFGKALAELEETRNGATRNNRRRETGTREVVGDSHRVRASTATNP